MIVQTIVSQATNQAVQNPCGQGSPERLQAGAGQGTESVNAVFARIASGRAQPDDFARYVDLWDKLQAAQWHRRPRQS